MGLVFGVAIEKAGIVLGRRRCQAEVSSSVTPLAAAEYGQAGNTSRRRVVERMVGGGGQLVR